MSRFEELARLKELEAKAETGWMRGDAGNIYCEKCPHNYPLMMPYGINGCAAEISLAVELRNAAPWLLRIAEAFQPGDSTMLRELAHDEEQTAKFIAGFGQPDTRKATMLRRLQAVAEEMER